METIIKKAIEGGWNPTVYPDKDSERIFTTMPDMKNPVMEYAIKLIIQEWGIHRMVLDPLFWQALGRACGWVWDDNADTKLGKAVDHINIYHALRFHEINLTQGWDAAVEWLNNLIKNQ